MRLLHQAKHVLCLSFISRASLLVWGVLLRRKPTDLFCGISGGSVG